MTSTAPKAIRIIKTWDWGVRLFHWLLVAAIALAFLSSEEGSALSPWHGSASWVAAILIAFRLLTSRTRGASALPLPRKSQCRRRDPNRAVQPRRRPTAILIDAGKLIPERPIFTGASAC